MARIVTFARRYESHVDCSCALVHDTGGVVPMLVVQPQRQELANGRIIFKVRAYTWYASGRK
jgi:hypothetical protein